LDKTPECGGQTDRQTDRQKWSGYYSGLYFKQRECAVKTNVNIQSTRKLIVTVLYGLMNITEAINHDAARVNQVLEYI